MAITNETALDPSIDRRLAVDVDAAEGDKLVAYQDTLGNWTCGRGHLMPPPARAGRGPGSRYRRRPATAGSRRT